ncbi:MAG: hypothetical protein QME05_05840 [Candidatus Margulisbacteria bacterium]|nr:hypothetical protein [Candidatus Margulisiibacteriota bacterium]
MNAKKIFAILVLSGFIIYCSGFSNIPRWWEKVFKPKTTGKKIVKLQPSEKKKKIARQPAKRALAKPSPAATPMQTVLSHGPGSIEVVAEPSYESFLDAQLEKPQEKEDKNIYEVGVIAGLFSGAIALNGEVRFPLPKVYGPATTSLRCLFGIAQSANSAVRYYPIQADYIFNFPPGYITGVENYFGLGLNFNLYSTNVGIGLFGGQACYGVQCDGFNGKLFGEIGYGLINSGSFASSQKGVSLLLGYRRNWPPHK